MSDNKSRILVTFIDDEDDELLGEVKLPPEQLPESFAAETTLRLDDDDWLVVSAEPATRGEFAQSKKLTLRLSRVLKVDPQTILFSLPSIHDGLPACGKHPVTGNELAMHEDNWRQFEFVSREFEADVDRELAAIQKIHDEQWAEQGWRELHVRTTPARPIAEPFLLSELMAALGVTEREPIAFSSAATQIEQGFVLTAADEQRVYGLLGPGAGKDGLVTVLGVTQTSLAAPPENSISALRSLAEKHNLELVQWCACKRATADSPQFRQLLVENAE